MPNSQYERDFNDLGALKRPGRLDFKTLNNVDNAGDGYPGMQKAIRNYFHEGYLEKDINMNTHKIINLQAPSGNNDGARKVDVDAVQNDLDDFDDELKSLLSVEVQQLQNIDSVTISNAQWGYLGGLDQLLAQAQSPTFMGLTLSANLVTTSTVDGVNVSTFKSSYDTHVSGDGSDHSFIDQSVKQADSPTFVGLTLSANLVTSSTIDGVDIAARDHDKYTDAEALVASYKGFGSATVRHSHDADRQLSPINDWYKVKEITIHESIKCDIYWELKSTAATNVESLLKKNGVQIGSSHNTSSTSYVPFTESDHIFVRGDTIELWGRQFSTSGSLWARYFRVKYDLAENTY